MSIIGGLATFTDTGGKDALIGTSNGNNTFNGAYGTQYWAEKVPLSSNTRGLTRTSGEGAEQKRDRVSRAATAGLVPGIPFHVDTQDQRYRYSISLISRVLQY